MVEHLSDFWRQFKDDPSLHFYLFVFHGNNRPGEDERLRKRLPLPRIGKLKFYLKHWDMVVAADHLYAGKRWTHINPYSWPNLRISHGIANKRVGGELYAFGKNCYDDQGKIRYTRMFVSSEAERQTAIAMDARFADHVCVVGNIKFDSLAEQAVERDAIRQRLGIKPEEKLVMVASTFGPDCLFSQMGEALINEMRKLEQQYRFALSIHPMEYLPRADGARPWGDRLVEMQASGFLIILPTEDWEPYMLACDVILTDHTSLALYGLALERPFVFAPIKDGLVGQGTPTACLMEIFPILNQDSSNLQECISESLESYPTDSIREIKSRINSCPGHAGDRIRKEVYALLK